MGIPRKQQFGRKRGYFKIKSPARKILADAQFWIILSKPLDSGKIEGFLLWFSSLNRMVVNVPRRTVLIPPPITKVEK